MCIDVRVFRDVAGPPRGVLLAPVPPRRHAELEEGRRVGGEQPEDLAGVEDLADERRDGRRARMHGCTSPASFWINSGVTLGFAQTEKRVA